MGGGMAIWSFQLSLEHRKPPALALPQPSHAEGRMPQHLPFHLLAAQRPGGGGPRKGPYFFPYMGIFSLYGISSI